MRVPDLKYPICEQIHGAALDIEVHVQLDKSRRLSAGSMSSSMVNSLVSATANPEFIRSKLLATA